MGVRFGVAALGLCIPVASAAPPLEVILALEISPGTEQAIGLIRSRLFRPEDRAAVVVFGTRGARVLQGLTDEHAKLDTALQKAGIRVTVNGGVVQTNDLVAGILEGCQELDRNGAARRRRAVIVIFQGDDPQLRMQMESVTAALNTADAKLYAIVIDEYATAPRRPGYGPVWTPHLPGVTGQLISEIAQSTGGKAIHKNWDVKPILEELRKN